MPASSTGALRAKALFSSIEDEADYLHITVFGQAIDNIIATFLRNPAIIVRGTIERPAKEAGASLLANVAWPLRVGMGQ